MKKLTKRGIVTIAGCLALGSYILLPNAEDTLSIDGKELFKQLDQLEVTYDQSTIFESLYSYEEFKKEGLKDYQCTHENNEFTSEQLQNLEPLVIAKKILKHKIPTNQLYTSFPGDKAELLAEALDQAILNCPAEKEKIFCHLLSELKIVQCMSETDKQGEYLKEDKTIVVYMTEIEKIVEEEFPYQVEYTYQELLDYNIETILEHELNHVVQDFCSCYSKVSTCFNNSTLWEALAEEDTSYPLIYQNQRKAFHLLSYTFLFNEDYEPYELHNLLYNNDLKTLFKLFDADTDDKQKEVYNMLQALNLSQLLTADDTVCELKNDYRTTLTKQFCKNLIHYNELNNLPLEEVLYFYKSFLQQCLYDIIPFTEGTCIQEVTIEYVHDMIEIQDALMTYCVNYYEVDYDTVTKKLQTIDQENNNQKSTEVIIPYVTYENLSSSKRYFLQDMQKLSNQTDFKLATSFIKDMVKQENSHTFKKKK